MANGKTHAKDSIELGSILGPTILGISFASGLDVGTGTALGLASLLGSWLGVLFTPDLDMETRTLADRLPFIGLFWTVLWLPYAVLIPHRSWLSHTPLLATGLRQLYFWGFVYIVAGIAESPATQLWVLNLPDSLIYWSFFVGLFTSDVAHWMRDF